MMYERWLKDDGAEWCNHVDTMTGVGPKLPACSVFSLFPALVTTCLLFHFSCPFPWMSSGVPPASHCFH